MRECNILSSRYFRVSSILLCSFIVLIVESNAAISYLRNNPYRRREVLDPQGKYLLEWETDLEEKRITFNVTVATKGYVGLGLARSGKMAGADMVIGGVGDNGKVYFSDRYAIANQLPKIDSSQDWDLHEAWERGNTTFLSFSRLLDTCDADHDLPITDDMVSVIWAYSERDDTKQYHFQHRGAFSVYLSDPDLVPDDIESFSRSLRNNKTSLQVMRFWDRRKMPPGRDTMYWCSFHKLPTTTKQHIVGFNTFFPTEVDREHVHHMILYRCRAPPGTQNDEFFGEAVKNGGSECYFLDRPNPNPIPYCREVLNSWAVGGRGIFFPENAGIPISDEPDEYMMMQVHYDNSNQTPNLTVNVALEAFYSDEIRKYDVGVMQLGDGPPGPTTILIPPSSTNHVVLGHCAPGCTERILSPTGGATIFALLLHTHTTGIGVRLQHFRNNKELPWIANDDNYNVEVQLTRLLKQERHIRPGDLLTQRCTYDSTKRNGSVVVGGFSTQEEMCTAFAYYYSRSPGFSLCRGEITNENYNWELLGIRNFTWDPSIRQMVITDPPQYRGMTVRNYLDNEIDWSIDFRERVQQEQIYQPQDSLCPRLFYEDPQTQLRAQVDSGILKRTGRLPGSDGRAFTSVDEGYIQESMLPRGIPRYKPPHQCTRVP